MAWIWLIVFLIAFAYWKLRKLYSYWTERGVPQGNPKYIFGDTAANITKTSSFAEMIQDLYKKLPGGRYSGMYQFLLPTLMLKDPELIKQLAVKDFEHFLNHRTFVPEDVDPLWAKNLFSLKGEKWRDMRATLSPAFTSSKMRTMFSLMLECSQQFTDYFLKQDSDLITIEMKDAFTRFTNDIIASTAFGIKCDSLKEQSNEFYLMGKEVTNFATFRKNLIFAAYLIMPQVAKYFISEGIFSKEVSSFFRSLVKETVHIRERDGIVRHDMINLLMEARKGRLKYEEHANGVPDAGFATVEESQVGKVEKQKKPEITDDDMTAQALIFFFAGFETVSTLMCFTSYELALNPDIQQKLQQEIDDTLNECDGVLTYEALLKMQYMDMVISESLRKWPAAIASDRECTKPYTIEPKNPGETPVHLQVGDVLWIPTFAMHRDPQYFPNPDRFDPERFSNERKGEIIPYSYTPFGVGPRNCIGSRFALLEVKAVFFHLLSKFDIIPVEKTQIPFKFSRKQFNLNSEKGFWLGLKKRDV